MHSRTHARTRAQVRAAEASRPLAPFKVGDVLDVRMVVPEAGRKEYVYRGVCIARYNKGIRSAFKIYNVLPDSGGFVQHIPLYMPDLLGVEVVGKVRVAGQAEGCCMLHARRGARRWACLMLGHC